MLWKYMQSSWEAKRLCEEDAKRFLSARYRVLAFLGARGLRQLGGVWPKVGQYMSTQGHSNAGFATLCHAILR